MYGLQEYLFLKKFEIRRVIMDYAVIEKGEVYEVEIADIGTNGEGIGKIGGLTVFVENGVPGDKVKVIIETVKKNYSVGRIMDILVPSRHRVVPVCTYADTCGGCQIQQIDYKAQLKLKTDMVKAAISRIGKLKDVLIHDTVGMDEPNYYRNKAQFPVSVADGKALIGFYKKGSHEIINIESCYIQHSINDYIISAIKAYMDQNKVDAYDEATGKGLIRHLITKVGFATGEIMVMLVTAESKIPNKEHLIQLLIKEIPKVNIIQNINRKKGNKILGDECITIYGKDRIVDYIGELQFLISPLSFFQVNPMQTKILYNKVLEFAELSGKETVCDIYCGIGTISLFLAQRAKKVYGVEVVEAAIEDAKENAAINNIHNVEFFTGEAEEVFPRLYKQGLRADVVVVDPPRKGCDEKVLDTIVKLNPQRIVYVSCNPATLARDLKYLDENGYRTVEVQPVDMFPHTSHVECVVRLQRQNP